MNKIQDTLSLCEYCYRHVPAIRYEKDGKIWLWKKCKWHGEVTHLVEPDAKFYLNYKYKYRPLKSYFIEVTNKCNLACPHCYQQPDNKSMDPTIDNILDLISKWPDDGYPVALVGAEPTTRKDLAQLINAIHSMPGKLREIMILTNGVYLSNLDYAKSFENIENLKWTIGLNHPDYQGMAVRKKQIAAIDNMKACNLKIKNISYTLESINQIEYCMNEMQDFGLEMCDQYRIRCGADIGRYPGGPKIFLSELVSIAKKIADSNSWSWEVTPNIGNRSHYAVNINGIPVKIIQWPDVKTIDLGELQTEAIADIIPGKPPSPLVHQVILRDGAFNKGLPLYDTIPKEWLENYGCERN